MASYKMQPISHSEYLSGKYKNVSSSSGEHEAKVWYKDNGSINEDETYSDNYLRSNGLGRYAKKAETSSKSSSSSSKSSSSSGSSSRSSSSSSSSRSSSSSSSSSIKSSSSNSNNESSNSDMDSWVKYRRDNDIQKNSELKKYLERLVGNSPEFDVYDENILKKVHAVGEDIGMTAEAAEAAYVDYYKMKFDIEYWINRQPSALLKDRVFQYVKPTKNREQILKYMRYTLYSGLIAKCFNSGNNDGSTKYIKEWWKELETVVKIHHSGDAEVNAAFEELQKDYKKVLSKLKRTRSMMIIIPLMAFLIMLLMALICS